MVYNYRINNSLADAYPDKQFMQESLAQINGITISLYWIRLRI